MPRKDYQAFASSFLDLWQEQVARAMSDTDFLQALMENMQQMQAGAFGYDRAEEKRTDRHAADASGPRDDELDAMRQRLATCERKIVKLEATIERLNEAKPEPASRPATKRAAPKRRAGASGNTATPAARASKKSVAKKPAKKPVKKSAAKKSTTRKPVTRKRAIKRT